MPLEVGGIFLAVHHDEEGTKIAEMAVRRPEYKASIEAKFAECRGILNDVHESFTNEIGFLIQQGAEWRFLTFVHRERIDNTGSASSTTSVAAASPSTSNAPASAAPSNVASPASALSAGGSVTSAFPDANASAAGSTVSTTPTTTSPAQHPSYSSRQRGWFCVSVVFALHDPTVPIGRLSGAYPPLSSLPPTASPLLPPVNSRTAVGSTPTAAAGGGGGGGGATSADAHLHYVHSLLETERELSRWHPVVESLAAKLIRAEAKQRFLTIALQHTEMKSKGESFSVLDAQGLFSGHRNAFDVGVPERVDFEDSDSSDDDDDDDSFSSGDGSDSTSSSTDAEGQEEEEEEKKPQQTELAWVLQGYLERICSGGGFLWEAMGNFMFVFPGGVADPRFAGTASASAVRGGGTTTTSSATLISAPRCAVAPTDVPLLLVTDAGLSHAFESAASFMASSNFAMSGGTAESNCSDDAEQQQQQRLFEMFVDYENNAAAGDASDLLLQTICQYLARARSHRLFPHVQQMSFDLRAQLPLVQEAVSVLAAGGFVRVCPGFPLSVHHWAFSGWCDVTLALTQRFYADARGPCAAEAREMLVDYCRERGRLDVAASRAAATIILGPLLGSLGGPILLPAVPAAPPAKGGVTTAASNAATSTAALNTPSPMTESDKAEALPAMSARTNASSVSASSTNTTATTASSATDDSAPATSLLAHANKRAVSGSNTMRGMAGWVCRFAASVGCPVPLDGSSESALFYGHAAATAALQQQWQQQQAMGDVMMMAEQHQQYQSSHHHRQHSHGHHQTSHHHRHQRSTSSSRAEIKSGGGSTSEGDSSSTAQDLQKQQQQQSARALVHFLATQLGVILRYAFAQQWVRTVEE